MFDVVFFAEIFEEFGIVRVDWFYGSTSGTFGENLHGVTAHFPACFFGCLGEAACD
jgi:hypothetical protein